MNGVVLFHGDDGTVIDLTEGVKCLYDLVINSMDWGSGFLSTEDALPVVHVARTCGFPEWERAYAYVNHQQHSHEQTVFLQARELDRWGPIVEHDHVLSSVGMCMWPRCEHVDPMS